MVAAGQVGQTAVAQKTSGASGSLRFSNSELETAPAPKTPATKVLVSARLGRRTLLYFLD